MEVHRCRFVDYTPSAINALAFAPNTTKPVMACGRANGDIEVWNPKNEWTLEKVHTIPTRDSVVTTAVDLTYPDRLTHVLYAL